MKRRFGIVVMVLLFLFSSCGSAPPAPLTEEEIANLREEYPLKSEYVNWNPLVCSEAVSLDRFIEMSDHWVWGRIGERLPDETVYTMVSQYVYQMYEAEVVESVYGVFEAGDTFVLAIPEEYTKALPSLDAGREYLMSVMPRSLKGDSLAYCIGLDGMFYVTEDDYVLSVTGLEQENAQQLSYTGQHVSNVIEAIRTIKSRQWQDEKAQMLAAAEHVVEDMTTLWAVQEGKTASRERYYYTDSSGVEYSFDGEKRLVTYEDQELLDQYFNQKFKQTSSEFLLSSEDEAEYFKALYENQIENISEYSEVWGTDYGTYYEIMLSWEHSQWLADSILLNIGKNGDVLWFRAYYCDLEEVTQKQYDEFWNKMDEYVTSTQKNLDSYDASVTFQGIEGKIMASFTVIYNYTNGASYGQSFAFIE